MFKSLFSGLKGFFKKQGATLGFWIIRKFGIRSIKSDPIRLFIKDVLDPAEEITKALTDGDPNDRDQIMAILCDHSDQLTRGTVDLLLALAANNIDDEDVLEQVEKALEFATIKVQENINCK